MIYTADAIRTMRDRTTRFPAVGSDVRGRFLNVCDAYLLLLDELALAEREIARLNDDLSTAKSALKSKGGRKR